MKRVLITGGTGLIGRHLSADLAGAGYEVILLSRRPERAGDLPAGVRAVKWDGRTPAGWAELANGAAAIVNLAGESIGGGLWTPGRKQRIRDSRLNAGAAIVEAVRRATPKPDVVIQASGIGVYGDGGDKVLSEESPAGRDWLPNFAATEWEPSHRAGRSAGRAPGHRAQRHRPRPRRTGAEPADPAASLLRRRAAGRRPAVGGLDSHRRRGRRDPLPDRASDGQRRLQLVCAQPADQRRPGADDRAGHGPAGVVPGAGVRPAAVLFRVCPTALFEMSEILRALGPDADRIGALFITVDPERDTPAVIKDYLSSFDPHLVGLTGDPATIAAVAKAYRVYFKKVPLDQGGYTMDHTAIVYLMDKTGRFVSPFSLKRTTDAAAADLRRYL